MRAFYVLSAVQVLSFIGSTMTTIAVGIWLFQQTGNASPVLLTAFFGGLPQMIGGALTGVLIDRWDKRTTLILADTGQALGTIVLIVSLLSGRFEIWHLYAVALWQGIFGMLQAPTMLAFITGLVPDERRERANAIQQITGRIAGIVAPAITALVYQAVRLEGILLIDFVTFALAVLVTARIIPTNTPAPSDKPAQNSIWQETSAGIRYLWSQRGLFWLVVHGTIINFFLSSVLSLNTPYILTITNSEYTLALVLGVLNIGPIVGAGLIAFWGGTRPRIHTIMPAILLIALAVMAYGLAQSSLLLVLTSFFILLPMPMVTVLIPAIIQAKTPAQLQGRVFAVVFQLAALANPLALLLTGWMIDKVLEPAIKTPVWTAFAGLVGSQPGAGMRLLIVIAGSLMFLVTISFYMNAGIRSIEKSPEPSA